MLDIKFIRENAELIKKGAADKRIRVDIDKLLSIDASLRPLQQGWEEHQAERNQLSKTIGKTPPAERPALIEKVNSIKAAMAAIEAQMEGLKTEFEELLLLVPNPAREDVPVGKDDADNVELRTWGEIPKFDFKALDHVAIGEKWDMLDTERGVKLAGSRSYILKGELAQLESALMRFTCDLLNAKGYTQMSIPVLVKEDCMVGTGYFPTGREQAYTIDKDELALVGTAEVALTSYLSGEIVDLQKLPYRCFAQSSCFRREAGTYGKDTHGLYRVHQFQKVEQVIIAPADVDLSVQLHDELLNNAEEIMQALQLPYRVVYVCTGDLGMGQLRKHDIETWMPSREHYSETHSCSTFHDYQARRLKMRYRDENKKTQICYTLNNTAIATPRVLIPLLEVHQQADGRVRLPEPLRAYMGGKEFIGGS